MSATPARPTLPGQRAYEVALLVLALWVSGLVALALAWSGSAPYARLIAGGEDPERICIELYAPDGTVRCQRIARLVEVHAGWSAYVTGAAPDAPRFEDVRFTDDERRHMADVRRVFDGAKLLAALGAAVVAFRLLRARARGAAEMWRLALRGALVAGGAVALVGLIAVLAFEPLFLLFHYVFFPQGNFLFDPATSNLVRVYPDWYWEGITLAVGLSFIALSAAVAGLAALRLRAVT